MIKVENINKSFNSSQILKNISFQINKGESVAIIGQSGVGKSVLIKHLNGLIHPDSGDIWVEGKNINEISYQQLQEIRKFMSMVFQFGALFDSMSIEKNIELALKNSETELLDNTQIITRIEQSQNIFYMMNLLRA